MDEIIDFCNRKHEIGTIFCINVLIDVVLNIHLFATN